ncbi:chitinase [Enterobacter cloacae subsp. cloacae]|uniref:carbohydrate-binding protein n=1 Tax=Enterobacter cloacae TaxID=550 RepID=UPI001C5B3C92|nr:glycosyl hydrolase family 18 protein [Enterobacter cloacae]MBW4201860.1 chitinase [Enterobacter cloacae subsp. cloacae]
MNFRLSNSFITLGLLLSSVLNCTSAYSSDMASSMPEINNKDILVGFWHNWPGAPRSGYQQGQPADMNLSDIPSGYNVIAVAFMKGEGIPTFKPYNMTDQAFRAQISILNQQGRPVLLSLGGAEAHIELHKGQEQAFADEIIRLVDTYGFDGLDLDLEQAAIVAGDNQTVIPAALKIVKQHFRDMGMNFIISMAPEFPYLRTGGNYIKYITALKDDYDFIAPQFYNQGGDGVWVDGVGWLTQNDDNRKAEFLYYLTDSIIHGTRGFEQIPANKFVIGLPSNIDAAATGYVQKVEDVRSTFEKLAADGTPIKGLMTWSVNWDGGRNSAGNAYNYEFVNRYESLINGDIPVVDDVTPPTKPGKPFAQAASDKVKLNWSASRDDVGVTQYEIWRNGNKISTSSQASFVDTNVFPETTYTYYVIALDKANNRSDVSEATQITTEKAEQADNEKPTAPQNLQATKVTSSSVTLSWSASKDNVGVEHYNIIRNGISIGTIATTSFTDSKVNESSHYHYNVTAVDAAGNTSSLSQDVSVDTPASSSSSDEWDSAKIYNGGDLVKYNGIEYRAKWWSQNNIPGQNDVWELTDKSKVMEWSANTAYSGGESTVYQGNTYQAKWWTRGDIPGKSDVWVMK